MLSGLNSELSDRVCASNNESSENPATGLESLARRTP